MLRRSLICSLVGLATAIRIPAGGVFRNADASMHKHDAAGGKHPAAAMQPELSLEVRAAASASVRRKCVTVHARLVSSALTSTGTHRQPTPPR
eukprot:5530161-Prymnesium_polylepis.1